MNKIAKPNGFNVYEDDRGRAIYYSRRKKIGYVIVASDYKMFNIMQYRYFICAGLAIVSANALVTWPVAIALGVVGSILLEYYFQAKFLAKMTQLTNFVPIKKPSFSQQLLEVDSKKLLLKAGLYFAFGILIVLNAYDLKWNFSLTLLSWLIGLVAIAYSLTNLWAYFKKKKN